ncbi:hypothetical protein [Haloflavibacter putidus]|uniref:Uncharacterized protein n=1 Tax=Haloflavibacter putidus TaxID=2576776 RepID=A0A507ZY21_9FLAO|nr:hypothetical protein [Haloflavibacter putidus]TQD40608.1 hypothetical protein FKR84_01120 [Haloflavibacter putidus]
MEKFPQKNDYKKAVRWSSTLVGLEDVESTNHEKLKQVLGNYLNRLITEDFNKLIAILYRIDVSEEKARRALSVKKKNESPGEILANLVIERQLQKIKTRRKYS